MINSTLLSHRTTTYITFILHESWHVILTRRYLVSNDTISAVSKFNKYETCQQKITSPLTNERHVLVDGYFCAHLSHI